MNSKIAAPFDEHTTQHWREFYTKHNLRNDPSPFARWCLENHLSPDSRILELGCGNGRDSFAFLHHGLPCCAIDGCKEAIEDNVNHYRTQQPPAKGDFYALHFADIKNLHELAPEALQGVNTIYTRFVIHAIPEALEDLVLDFCDALLPQKGRMLHEFRTTKDPLMEKGEKIGEYERLTDHYRRFIDAEAFRSKLSNRGWREVFFIESDGLAVHKDDNPVVARIIVEKG